MRAIIFILKNYFYRQYPFLFKQCPTNIHWFWERLCWCLYDKPTKPFPGCDIQLHGGVIDIDTGLELQLCDKCNVQPNNNDNNITQNNPIQDVNCQIPSRSYHFMMIAFSLIPVFTISCIFWDFAIYHWCELFGVQVYPYVFLVPVIIVPRNINHAFYCLVTTYVLIWAQMTGHLF